MVHTLDRPPLLAVISITFMLDTNTVTRTNTLKLLDRGQCHQIGLKSLTQKYLWNHDGDLLCCKYWHSSITMMSFSFLTISPLRLCGIEVVGVIVVAVFWCRKRKVKFVMSREICWWRSLYLGNWWCFWWPLFTIQTGYTRQMSIGSNKCMIIFRSTILNGSCSTLDIWWEGESFGVK